MPAREVKIWNANTSTWEFLGLAEPPDATITFGTALPQALGTASAGTATVPSRADHVHVMPSAGDVGAVGTATTITAGTALAGGGDLSTSRTLNVVLSDATPLAVGTPAAGTATSPARADHVHEGTTLSSATPAALGTAAAGTATTAARGDHVHTLPSASDIGAIGNALIDAAGDLLVGSADNTVGRLALGTNGYVLTVDTAGSGVAKVKWAAPASGGLSPFLLMGA